MAAVTDADHHALARLETHAEHYPGLHLYRDGDPRPGDAVPVTLTYAGDDVESVWVSGAPNGLTAVTFAAEVAAAAGRDVIDVGPDPDVAVPG